MSALAIVAAIALWLAFVLLLLAFFAGAKRREEAAELSAQDRAAMVIAEVVRARQGRRAR